MPSDEILINLIRAIERLSDEIESFNESMPFFKEKMGKVEAIQEAKKIEQVGKELLNQDIQQIWAQEAQRNKKEKL